MKKKFTLSIIEFALPSPRKGSIDAYSGFGTGQLLGMELHQEIQQRRKQEDPTYEAEVWCSHTFKAKPFAFEIVGKMDGCYYRSLPKIEEIKSGFDLNKLQFAVEQNPEHPYCLQLKTYGYFLWLRTKKIPELNLHLVSSRNKKSIDFPVELNIDEYEAWLAMRLGELVTEVKHIQRRIKQRQVMAKQLSFPFPETRPGQRELIASIEQGFKRNEPMLLQAPTGLGKTMGVLFPALKNAMQRGQKLFYLTPKNAQHQVALAAVDRLQSTGVSIKALLLTAKRKICLKQEPLCNAQYCEFAEQHYTKVSEAKVIEQLRKLKRLTVKKIQKYAKDHCVCPYDIQMALIPTADVVIGDYNYVFSPKMMNSRVTQIALGEEQKPNVIIDEAHNLPARAMDYYSTSLSALWLERLLYDQENIPQALRITYHQLLIKSITIIRESGLPAKQVPHVIEPKIKTFVEQETAWREFLAHYLESDAVISEQDPVLFIYNAWHDFCLALEWAVQADQHEFFVSYLPAEHAIKITCCDASQFLQSAYLEMHQVIGFSATLKPFEFYRQLIGLPLNKLKTEEFTSPFPKEHRKIIIIPQVSSRYSERERNYPKISEAITRIVQIKKGNYLAFFPSFYFLERVLSIFQPPDGYHVVSQTKGMRQESFMNILAQLRHDDRSHIIFAVQGGMLAEGIDYPGDLAIGVFVVGVPLPNYDWEREQMRNYYEVHYQQGANYAYTYPAMAKAVQAAGRVIRSQEDKGIIILMDNRFLAQDYAQCMPKDWFSNDPEELLSTQILKDIEKFWQ